MAKELTEEQQKRINEARGDGKKLQEEILKIIEETTKATEKQIDTVDGLAEKYAKLAREAKMSVFNNDEIEMQNQYFEVLKAIRESEQAYSKAKADGDDESRIRLERNLAMLNEQAKTFEKMGVAPKKMTESMKEFAEVNDSVFSSFAKNSFMFLNSTEGFAGTIGKFATAMETTDKPMSEMLSSFRKHFNLTTLANSMIAKFTESTIEMVEQFDQAAASFAAATGTGDQFTGTLLEMRQEGNALGVTFENSSKALQSLIERQVGFLNSSKTAQKEMATQVALMERIGISTDTSAEMMNVFTINMGKSQGAAIQMTKALASMGGVLGNSQKFLQNFQESLKDLAVYGDGAVEVFSNMAAAARAAGVEVNTLTGLAAKFDTFSEAAETVGRLNAMLGSQMSSTEMLLMTEDQRIETLIQQVQVSGESFAQMDRFKQKAIAAAAGISDMNEAQRIFGMNMKDYKKYQKDMETQAKIQDNFNKAIEATIPLTEKFSQFMAEFAIAVKPIADFIGWIVGGLTSFMASLSEGEKVSLLLVSAIGLVVLAFKGLSLAAGGLGASIGAGLGSGLAAAGGAMTSLVASTGAATPVITAFGTAATGLTPIIGAFATAIGGAAAAMGGFVLPLLGIALAIGGVAISIAIVVGSFGYLIGQFVELAKVGPAAVMVLLSFAAAIAAVSLAGVMGPLGIYGAMATMTTIIGSLAAMKLVIGDETSAISNALENLALIATGTSAKAMGGVTATITSELKGAVQAAMTTKLEIELKINEGKFKDIVDDAIGTYLDSPTGQKKILAVKMA